MQEKLNTLLTNISVVANIQKIGTCEVEKEDYYSKCFSGTPSVVTNKGCLNSKIQILI